MCDTVVALGNSTKDGSVIFAKNSDRDPNEPHLMMRIPRKKHSSGERLQCTYIEIDQVPETFEVLLLKPSWIWGCEMGANEFGLNIGNEAVFTRELLGEPSLTGMDMVRLALERCHTSDQALDLMVALLEQYGQGGNCGFEKPFTYHNSFLIADSGSAWVLETAGKYWAAQKVKDVRAISNVLTIRKDFNRSHPELVKNAADKGWCQGADDFDFAACYADPKLRTGKGASRRLNASQSILKAEKGRITVGTMKRILRSHAPECTGVQFQRGSGSSICMHAGGAIPFSTTGSYVAQLSNGKPTYWVTGASTPCLSLFKPLWLIPGEPLTFSEGQEAEALQYWTKREKLHRNILENRVTDLEGLFHARDQIEADLEGMVERLNPDAVEPMKLIEVMRYAVSSEDKLIEYFLKAAEGREPVPSGGPRFKKYWEEKTAKLSSRTV